MFYFYNGHHFWGIHLVWWFFWSILLIATPYELPG